MQLHRPSFWPNRAQEPLRLRVSRLATGQAKQCVNRRIACHNSSSMGSAGHRSRTLLQQVVQLALLHEGLEPQQHEAQGEALRSRKWGMRFAVIGKTFIYRLRSLRIGSKLVVHI